jgi:hypothetical protein
MQFKIDLLDTAPVIWRRIQVPAEYTFWDLHVAIQDSMGWLDSHLHAFEVEDPKRGEIKIGIPDEDAAVPVVAGWKRKLSRHFKWPGDQLVYEYDFGDSWRHSVLLESIILAELTAVYPRCIDGAQKCPPEDCGGPVGFEEFLRVVGDPEDEEHESTLEWCGGHFDPSDFDPAQIEFDDPTDRLEALDEQ